MIPAEWPDEHSPESDRGGSEALLTDTEATTRSAHSQQDQSGSRSRNAPERVPAQDQRIDSEAATLVSLSTRHQSVFSAVTWSDLSGFAASGVGFELFENVLIAFMLSGIGWNIAAGYDFVRPGVVSGGIVLTTIFVTALFTYETIPQSRSISER